MQIEGCTILSAAFLLVKISVISKATLITCGCIGGGATVLQFCV